MANHTPKGKFQPGVSGNPAGRPKEDAEFKQLAKAKSEAALNLLIGFMEDEKADKELRARCAIYVIERAHGKPIQEVKGVSASKYTEIWIGAAKRAERIGADGRIRSQNQRAGKA